MAQEEKVHRVLKARNFVLVDQDGNRRGEFATDSLQSYLVVRGKGGVARAQLSSGSLDEGEPRRRWVHGAGLTLFSQGRRGDDYDGPRTQGESEVFRVHRAGLELQATKEGEKPILFLRNEGNRADLTSARFVMTDKEDNTVFQAPPK
jgi:hypothetical protein